jgi:hypothetical protein
LPLVILLRSVDTTGRYVGLVCLVWIISTSNVVLIMIPKVLAFYGVYGGNSVRRGARSGVHVSGINTMSNSNPPVDPLSQQFQSRPLSSVSESAF